MDREWGGERKVGMLSSGGFRVLRNKEGLHWGGLDGSDLCRSSL